MLDRHSHIQPCPDRVSRGKPQDVVGCNRQRPKDWENNARTFYNPHLLDKFSTAGITQPRRRAVEFGVQGGERRRDAAIFAALRQAPYFFTSTFEYPIPSGSLPAVRLPTRFHSVRSTIEIVSLLAWAT